MRTLTVLPSKERLPMVGFFHLKDGRGKPKDADYLLRYTRDFTVAVVEALLFRSRTTGTLVISDAQ
ncbi:MAG: hypothetical protein WAK31_20790 [Chthoniobacterales bacterium]